MRILVVTRLFSGFADSLRQGRWQPSGAPAIARLFAGLAASAHDVRFVLTAKEPLADGLGDRAGTFRLDGFAPPIRLLAGMGAWSARLGRLRWYLCEAGQALRVVAMVWRQRPAVVYLDRGNLWAAAAVAWLTPAATVYRVMGITENLTASLAGRGPQARLTRFLRKAPLTMAICTLDGSGGEVWLRRLFRKDVVQHVLLNGVDRPGGSAGASPATELPDLPSGRTVVGLIGRLDAIKASDRFCAAFLKARAARPGELFALIVGDGEKRAEMENMVREAGATADVLFTGALPHNVIPALHRRCDIYVSLNRQGNLSNANLEALLHGACAVFPRSDPDIGRDVATDELLPADVVWRVASSDAVDDIAAAIVALHDDPAERERRRRRTAEIAAGFATWEDRIAREIALIEEAASRAGRLPAIDNRTVVQE